jgi:hypothetical protein
MHGRRLTSGNGPIKEALFNPHEKARRPPLIVRILRFFDETSHALATRIPVENRQALFKPEGEVAVPPEVRATMPPHDIPTAYPRSTQKLIQPKLSTRETFRPPESSEPIS